MSVTLRRGGGGGTKVGRGQATQVMALIGCAHQRDTREQLRKLDALAQMKKPPAIVADLSIVGSNELIPEILGRGFIASALPIYGVERRSSRIDASALLERAIEQMELGVGLITIHPTASRQLVELSRRRFVPWTSRGGGLVIADLLAHDAGENVYLRILPELIVNARRTNTVLSIGASFRSANIFDSLDLAQEHEIAEQLSLAERITNAGVGAILESPGHSRPRDIVRIAGILSRSAVPIMPLGPIPTDSAVGQDHISAAIGATLMGIHGAAHILASVTREEHTGGVPSLVSTVEAVEAAAVAAHIIDIETMNDTMDDFQIVAARAEKATCIGDKSSSGCSRCADTCPLIGARDARERPSELSVRKLPARRVL